MNFLKMIDNGEALLVPIILIGLLIIYYLMRKFIFQKKNINKNESKEVNDDEKKGKYFQPGSKSRSYGLFILLLIFIFYLNFFLEEFGLNDEKHNIDTESEGYKRLINELKINSETKTNNESEELKKFILEIEKSKEQNTNN